MKNDTVFPKLKIWARKLKSFLANFNNRHFLLLIAFILVNASKNLYFHSIVAYHQLSFNNLIFHSTILLTWAVLFAGIGVYTRSRAAFSLIYFGQLLYLIVNLTYFLYFKNYLFFNVIIQLALQTLEITKAGIVPFYYQNLVMLVDLPLFILLSRNRFFFGKEQKRGNSAGLALVLVSLIVLSGSYFWRTKHSSVFFAGDSKIVFEYGLLVAQINKYIGTFTPGQDFTSLLQTSPRIIKFTGNAMKQNIIVIQVESMESGSIYARYKGKPVMPYLNGLRRKSIFYPFCLSYHLGGGTSDAEFTILNSVQPLVNYPVFKVQNYEFDNSFIRVLANNGFGTFAFHGNEGTFWDRVRTFSKIGFQEFYDQIRLNLPKMGWGGPDHLLFEKTGAIIRNQKGPALNYIITMTSHSPFNLYKEYYTNDSYDRIENPLLRDYYISLSYVDRTIEHFMNDIKDLSNTTVIITGDHASIGEAGYRHSSYLDDTIYYELVPLFILTPARDKYRENGKAASFLDIAPTILYLSGISGEYHTDGDILTLPASLTNRIPFKGKWYDRSELYQKTVRNTGINPLSQY